MAKPKKPASPATIAENRRARHDYIIEERIEAGIALTGWEVKALRAGKGHIAEAHAIVKGEEAWLLGSRIDPLASASTHVHAEPDRTRKLLLHRKEIAHLTGAVDQKGYTLIPLRLYWKRGIAKIEIGLGRGRKKHDKRELLKQRDWDRQKARLLRHAS